MYVIVVYDMPHKKVTKVHKFLKTRLHWIQNSVFEGELSDSDFVKLKSGLKKFTKKGSDEQGSIILFFMPYKGILERQVFGDEKSPIDNMI